MPVGISVAKQAIPYANRENGNTAGFRISTGMDRNTATKPSVVMQLHSRTSFLVGVLLLANFAISSGKPSAYHSNSYTDAIRIHVSAGWNLISIPLEVPNWRKSALFPHAVSDAYGYERGYVQQDTLQFGKGYWLKFAVPETINIVGIRNSAVTIQVHSGWNLIGSFSTNIARDDVSCSPNDLIVSNLFAYSSDSGYTIKSTLGPGLGYWVRCKSSGVLTQPCSLCAPVLVSPENLSVDQSTQVLFRWHSVHNASSYNLLLARDSSFSNMFLLDSTTTDTARLVCGLPYDSKIYWRMSVTSGDSSSGWSEPWEFETATMPSPVSDTLAIFATVDGGPTGVWIFDPNTLAIIDSAVLPFVPLSMIVSPDGSTWYSMDADRIYSIDAASKQILKDTLTRGRYNMISDRYKRYLITDGLSKGDPRTEWWDRESLSLVRIDSPYTVTGHGVSSPVGNAIYCFGGINRGDFVLGYDVDSSRVIAHFPIADTTREKSMRASDIAISPDGRWLYVTVFNVVSWWGYGSFFVIDLSRDSVVEEYSCGSFANIAVSSDGQYVYLSDPGAWLGIPESFPTYQVLRYDVQRSEMEVFIDWRDFAGITGNSRSEQITVSPDGRSIYLLAGGTTCGGQEVNLVRLDSRSGSLLASHPFLSGGGIRRLKAQKYFRLR